ncbi:MAG: trypsin-like serine peptidase [Panacagrimonas sp.]
MLRLPVSILCLITLLGFPAAQAANRLSPRELDRVPIHAVTQAEVERTRRSLPAARENGPTLIALNVPAALGLAEGQWSVDGATAVWHLRLYSPQARLLIPSFSRFDLPPGAELRVMDVEGRVIQGPYTRRNRSRDGGLTTALVPGEQALLELRVPAAQRQRVDLQLSGIGHGLRSLTAQEAGPKLSGDCNIDAVCPQGDGWRDEIRSVVRLQIVTGLGFFTCTGQLINNTSQDETPYVLTANHCGITAINDARLVIYYNFLTSNCGGTPDGSLSQSQTGSTLVRSHTASDHTLIRLLDPPSSAFNVHFAGFDASPTAIPQSGRVIHHPAGEEKRISVYDTPAQRVVTSITGVGNNLSTFELRFSQGVTEPGSSGSALFNQDRRLVGVLTGGASSCTNPTGTDFFGRLDVAWANGLSRFLDPGDTGRTAFCGTDPGTDCNPDAGGGEGGTGSDDSGGGAFGAGWILALAGLVGRLRRRRSLDALRRNLD